MPQRTHESEAHARQSGFTLVEIAFAISILASAAVAFLGALVTSQMVAKQTRETNTANAAIVNAVETFRERCAIEFPKALGDYIEGVRKPDLPKVFGSNAELKAQVVMDETQIDPPVDLNGDGDSLDTNLQPTALRAVVLRLDLAWTRGTKRRTMSQTVVLSRSELEELYKKQTKQPVTDDTTQTPTEPITLSDYEAVLLSYNEPSALATMPVRNDLKHYLSTLLDIPQLSKTIKSQTTVTLDALSKLGASNDTKKLSAVYTALDYLLVLLDQ